MSHGFHQDQGNTLAAAGKHYHVTHRVPGVELLPGKMAQQFHLLFESEITDQVFEPGALRSFSRDQAQKICSGGF